MKIASFIIIFSISLNSVCSPTTSAQDVKRPFTVADDIELTRFDWDPVQGIKFSPDGSYVAVYSERGRLEVNRCESSLLFYRSEELRGFLSAPDGAKPPAPAWVVIFSTSKECPTIRDWRWLADSSGVAFLQRVEDGTQHLVLADLSARTIEQLSSATDSVNDFDVRDRKHFVYTAIDPGQNQRALLGRDEPFMVGTGRSFYQLFFPYGSRTLGMISHPVNLWAAVGGKRSRVKSESPALTFANGALALSPDGSSLVTMVPVLDIPPSWETLYPPSDKYSAWRLHAGHQDLESTGHNVYEYVRVNLKTADVRRLVNAPNSVGIGWWTQGTPSWSSDGEAILLPGTFLPSERQGPSRPCVAVVDLLSENSTCVEELKDQTVASMKFVASSRRRVRVVFYETEAPGIREYEQSSTGTWNKVEPTSNLPETSRAALVVEVKQSVNEPPRLVATSNGISRVLLNPNPQLENLESGSVEVYSWKAKDGRVWRGGLYMPSQRDTKKPYPLVIQTHGFVESRYIPSGMFNAAFAARALAAHGIAVLQVDDDTICSKSDSSEISCAVSGYEAAVNQLESDRLVDPEQIGIIGFSHTCFWVLGALTTTSSVHFKAASITDGVMADYNQYLMSDDSYALYYDHLIGARPIGKGLQTWLDHSPGFNLERLVAPLMVVGEGPESLLSMWQPYAILHFLNRPVELIMLNTAEHDLSNPAMRLASQGGSVDWFRFWLQNYEDPAPAKMQQYKRWRELRKSQKWN